MSVQVKGSGTIGGLDEGLNVVGVVTATSFNGALQGTSGLFSSGVDITGDLDVDGHTNLDNVSIAGVTTITGASGTLLQVNHTAGSGGQGIIRTKASQANSSSFIRAEDSGGTYIGLLKYGTGHSAYGALGAGDGAIYANSGGGNDTNITIMADSSTAYINFATGGNTERLRIASDGQIKQTAASGDTIFTFKRSDTNTTGAVGVLNFAASDDHSVANIQVLGDGNNEGAHIVFKTTSDAASSDPFNAATVERLRIRSDGKVVIGTNYTGGTLSVTGNLITDDGTNGRVTIQADGTSTNQILSTTTGFASYCNMKYQAADHIFLYGGNERMRVKTDGRISINDSSPSSNETLTIRPNGNIACDVSLKINNSTDSRIKFYDSGGTWRGAFGFTEYANSTDYPNFHDSFYLLTDPNSNGSLETAMRINHNGCFILPKQPCFSVAMSNDYTTSTTHTANFDTERFDQGNNFNTGSNGIFTAPVTGKYYMHAAIQTMQHGASQAHIMGVSFLVNGSVHQSKGSGDQYLGRNGDHYIHVHAIRILNLAQGDTVQVYIQLHGSVRIEGSGGTDRCNWQGYLVA